MTPHLVIGMGEVACGWAGCGCGSEATLDGRSLCRNHFYDIAVKVLENHRADLQQREPAGPARNALLKFLSEVVNQTTILVASAKFLSPAHRDQFLELSLSAVELYKRVQRNPRIPRNMPILVYPETDDAREQELANTVDVSKRGTCITTSRVREIGEKVWIEKPRNRLRALARVAWVKKNAPSQFLMGLEILDCEDFWELEQPSPKKGN